MVHIPTCPCRDIAEGLQVLVTLLNPPAEIEQIKRHLPVSQLGACVLEIVISRVPQVGSLSFLLSLISRGLQLWVPQDHL